MRKRALLLLLMTATLSACAVGPDYRTPDAASTLAVPAQFAHAGEQGVAADPILARFWTAFDDPVLAELVEDGLSHNRDLAQARARLRESRAVLRLKGFDRAPTVTAEAGYEKGLRSEAQSPGLSHSQREGDFTDAGFDAIWELDLFGRVRRDVEAAQADAQAQAADFSDVQVTVAAEIGRRYVELRGTQDQFAVARGNAEIQRQTLQITQALLDAGRGSQLDASRAEASWRTTLARIPELLAAEAADLHAISVLTGREPGALRDRLTVPRPAPSLPTLVGIETPESLLRRRPDIRAAERRLAAATARIGVAVGDLFPKLTLSGSIGYNAADLSDMGGNASERYAFGPSLSWAAFDLGRVRSRIEIAESRADGALAAYEGAVLGALEETESVLAAYGQAQHQRDELMRAEVASTAAANLARQRFEAGVSPFVDVLEAEQDLLTVQDALSRSRTGTATRLIALFKALGGPWETSAPAT